MALIEKRRLASGKTAYRVRVKYRGRTLSATHTDRLTAERWAAENGARIRNEAHFVGEANRQRSMSDLLERYEKFILPKKRDPKSQRCQLKYWNQRIGKLPVEQVTRAMISQCRDELGAPNKAGKVRSPATVVRYLACLSHVYTVAIGDWEWADTNPVRGIRKPREPRGRDRYLSDAERVKLLAACQASTSPDIYAVVLVALCSGMRRGEIMTLEWGDVDLTRQIVTLRQTKNGSRRSVPLCSPAYEVMAERAKVRRLDTQLVFPGNKTKTKGTTKVRPRDITKPWETARRKAGLVDFRFHDLRHSAASYMAMSGASTLEIAAVLGHRTLQMTQRYAHLSVEHLRSVVQRAAKTGGCHAN